MNVDEIRSLIDRADQQYYNGNDSGISDYEYDTLKEKLQEIAPDDPRLARVGAPVSRDNILNKFQHTFPMGSLNNARDVQEFKSWVQSRNVTEKVLIQPKVDGFSLALYFKDGVLQNAVTRGDSKVGEDITANAAMFKNVNLQVPNDFTGAIRGEALLLIEDWEKLDPNKDSNPRNIAAGTARRKDGQDCNHLTFYAFDIVGHELTSEQAKIQYIQELGFELVPDTRLGTVDDAIEEYERLEDPSIRNGEYNFWIDGLVIKINDLQKQEKLGYKNNRPKGMVAFKWKADQKKTKIEGVTITVGHTGKIIPTARLEPVRIGGTTVTNALLNNWDEIGRLGVAIGDEVIVQKSGEIIPKVIGLASKSDDRQIIDKPTECPVCSGPVAHHTNVDGSDTADIYCVSDDCPARQQAKIKRWIKKLDIKGIGDELIESLINNHLIEDVVDLYDLDASTLSSVELGNGEVGMSRACKIIDEINSTRTLTVDEFLGALGIKHLGKRRVQNIAESVSEFAELSPWLEGKLKQKNDEVGLPNVASDVDDSIQGCMGIITRLLQQVEVKPINLDVSGTLGGKSFCLTGAMSKPRKEIAADIEQEGGEIKKSVTKGLNYLVQADPSSQSSKTKKAIKYGTKVIGEEELYGMMAL